MRITDTEKKKNSSYSSGFNYDDITIIIDNKSLENLRDIIEDINPYKPKPVKEAKLIIKL